MIKTQKLVPQVYYNRSRDFQLLGRVYDIVFNYLKTNIDTINNFPFSENLNDQLVDLVCTTIGFKQMHNYNIKQLKGLCSIFMLAIRNKGSLKGLDLVLRMILNAENIADEAHVQIENNELTIFVPHSLEDITLLQDVLSYILPAGISCNIIRQTQASSIYVDPYTTDDVIVRLSKKAYQTSFITPPYGRTDVKTPSGMSGGINDNEVIMGYEPKIAQGRSSDNE